MTRRDSKERPARSWTRLAMTLFLLAVVITSGIAVYQARDQWWAMYLAYKR